MEKIGIRVLRHSAFYAPLLVTIAGDFLKNAGLQANYTIAGKDSTIPGGINDGTVQVAQSAVATSWMLLNDDTQPSYRHFAQINQRDGFFIVARNSAEEFQWPNLLGKTIIADHFFQPMAMLRYVLHAKSLPIDEITFVDTGDVTAIEVAYRNGVGDFVQLQGPVAQQLEHDGLGKVVASVGHEIGNVAFSSLCASPEWLSSDTAIAFTQAYQQARLYVQQSTAKEIAQIINSMLADIDFNVLCETISAYKQLGCWSEDIAISTSSYNKALDIFEFNDMLKQRYVYDSVISPPPIA